MVKKKTEGSTKIVVETSGKVQGPPGPEPKRVGLTPRQRLAKKHRQKSQIVNKVPAGALATKSRGVNKVSAAKKALPSLSSLGAVLDEVLEGKAHKAAKPEKQRGTSVKSAKQRQYIAVEESQRLHQVLAHPLYKKDPIAAITSHLQTTLPPPPPQPKAGSGKAGKNKKQAQKAA